MRKLSRGLGWFTAWIYAMNPIALVVIGVLSILHSNIILGCVSIGIGLSEVFGYQSVDMIDESLKTVKKSQKTETKIAKIG